MVPMALGQGPGASTRSSMAKVILGGQALSLLLTLLLTPVMYSLFDSLGGRVLRWAGAREDAAGQAAATPAPEGVARTAVTAS
jgi:HAE1 family hydrophobic/amphiphilic exporter-1